MEASGITQAFVSGLLMGGVYGLVALGLSLVFGVMKIINFAQGSFMMLGMYVSYWAFVLFGLDPYASMFISLMVLFVIGFLVQLFLIDPVIDTPEHNPLLVTLGLWLFLDNLALFLWSPDFRVTKVSYAAKTFMVGGIILSLPRLMAFAFAFIVAFLLYLFLKKTDMGKAIRAIQDEKVGAKLMGINVDKMNHITFGIGAACAGIAGSVITPIFHVEPGVGDTFVITAFVVVVLGGLGNFMGALVGGLILGVFEAMGAIFLSGSLKMLIIYLIFFLVLLFKPTGLFGTTRK
jgi:branched-chain amino acid transport system permease protein